MKQTNRDRQRELAYKISGWGMLIAFALLLLLSLINLICG